MSPALPHWPVTRTQTRVRRVTFLTLVFLGTLAGAWLFTSFLRRDGLQFLEYFLIALFTPLYYQLNVGFWTAVFGLFVLMRRKGDPLELTNTLTPEDEARPLTSSTAIVMPVYNEDPSRVFEGLRVMYRSLKNTGQLDNYDFFILSDSDNPNKWVEEEAAWLEICRQLGAFGKIFYRKRRVNLNRKSGNISDFCRRWGAKYRYMVVLDADSIMSGEMLVKMTRLMEKHPSAGIIQAGPRVFGAETWFGRVCQFAHATYGPAFMLGLNYWNLGEASYWGHNAIIRTAAFMENCGLPELPGKEPFGGHILSHDFVEAALMRKAGYGVWLLASREGSYEEGPPTLLDMLKRDRRWCQGNMQHMWLLGAKGWHFMSRLHFLHGILSYVGSLLWFAMLVVGTMNEIVVSTQGYQTTQTNKAGFILLMITLVLIFLPKIAILTHGLFDKSTFPSFKLRLTSFFSGILDTMFFTIMAPILMVFHSQFVVYTLMGKGVKWAEQRRKSAGSVDWREPILTFGPMTLAGLAWGAVALWVNPVFFLWLSPVLAGLCLSIPFAILSAGTSGKFGKSLFLTKEEWEPPYVIKRLEANLSKAHQRAQMLPELESHHGLMQALLDPYINGLHVSLLRQRRKTHETHRYLQNLSDRLVEQGPSSLSKREIKVLMNDHQSMLRLHFKLWSATGEKLSPWWSLAIRQYNVLTMNPVTALYR